MIELMQFKKDMDSLIRVLRTTEPHIIEFMQFKRVLSFSQIKSQQKTENRKMYFFPFRFFSCFALSSSPQNHTHIKSPYPQMAN